VSAPERVGKRGRLRKREEVSLLDSVPQNDEDAT